LLGLLTAAGLSQLLARLGPHAQPAPGCKGGRRVPVASSKDLRVSAEWFESLLAEKIASYRSDQAAIKLERDVVSLNRKGIPESVGF